MELPEIERHPLKPFPPPRKRWCIDFFYPNRTHTMKCFL